MSKDRIIKLIEALRDHCRGTRCEECQFLFVDPEEWYCELNEFTRSIKGTPYRWDIDKIKELL